MAITPLGRDDNGHIVGLGHNHSPVNLNDFATKSELAEAQLQGADVDLSPYATSTELAQALAGKANVTDVPAAYDDSAVVGRLETLERVDLSGFATKDELAALPSGGTQISGESLENLELVPSAAGDGTLVLRVKNTGVALMSGLVAPNPALTAQAYAWMQSSTDESSTNGKTTLLASHGSTTIKGTNAVELVSPGGTSATAHRWTFITAAAGQTVTVAFAYDITQAAPAGSAGGLVVGWTNTATWAITNIAGPALSGKGVGQFSFKVPDGLNGVRVNVRITGLPASTPMTALVGDLRVTLA